VSQPPGYADAEAPDVPSKGHDFVAQERLDRVVATRSRPGFDEMGRAADPELSEAITAAAAAQAPIADGWDRADGTFEAFLKTTGRPFAESGYLDQTVPLE
jgi:hypothetical protein